MRTPLTEQEHERLRYLLAHSSAARAPEDDRLISLGLAVNFSPTGTAVMARDEVVGENGVEPYYERDGGVNPVSYPTIGQPDVLEIAAKNSFDQRQRERRFLQGYTDHGLTRSQVDALRRRTAREGSR